MEAKGRSSRQRKFLMETFQEDALEEHPGRDVAVTWIDMVKRRQQNWKQGVEVMSSNRVTETVSYGDYRKCPRGRAKKLGGKLAEEKDFEEWKEARGV